MDIGFWICADGCVRGFPGKDILVPLTTSLYVPGKLASTDTVLVDVGTGFYIEKVSTLQHLTAANFRKNQNVLTYSPGDRLIRNLKQHGSSIPQRSRSWARTCRNWRALWGKRMGS